MRRSPPAVAHVSDMANGFQPLINPLNQNYQGRKIEDKIDDIERYLQILRGKAHITADEQHSQCDKVRLEKTINQLHEFVLGQVNEE